MEFKIGDRVKVVRGDPFDMRGEITAIESAQDKSIYYVKWFTPHHRTRDTELLTGERLALIDAEDAPPLSGPPVIKAGDVVYLRADVGMETPMTVMEINTGLGLGVCWLNTSREICTYFTKREVFATAEEVEREKLAADMRRQELVRSEVNRRMQHGKTGY